MGFHLRDYKGAGLLLCDDNMQVLLGKRKHFPYKGTWTIPGGGMDEEDRGSFERCALREARKEVFGYHSSIDPALAFSIDATQPFSSKMPLFEYRIYLAHADRTSVPLRFAHELEGCQWFDSRTLPVPLHPFMNRAVHKLILDRA